jgi:hypothetical protein
LRPVILRGETIICDSECVRVVDSLERLGGYSFWVVIFYIFYLFGNNINFLEYENIVLTSLDATG